VNESTRSFETVAAALKNRFQMHEPAIRFIDNFSAASIVVGKDGVGLTELRSRVISAWRGPVTKRLAELHVDGQPVRVEHAEYFPWSAVQTGRVGGIAVTAILYSPEYNRFAWIVRLQNDSAAPVTMQWNVTSEFETNGAPYVFRHGILNDDRTADATHDNKTATWLLRKPESGSRRLQPGVTHTFEVLVDYAITDHEVPVAPVAGPSRLATWALVQMQRTGVPLADMRDVIAASDRLHQWYLTTQDHDRDGLAEWRFTGCITDDSPAFDRYAPHSGAGQWMANYYLPPVASVSLNSYLMMDAKCLAYLSTQAGEHAQAAQHRATAARLEQRLKEVCLDDGQFFWDYDHQVGGFNRAVTLHGFLPLWAGVALDDNVRRSIIEDYLLNPRHFFGPHPFPFTAYSDPAYRPDGYWRGRVWVHTTYWMLELLWHYGYHVQVDAAADRLVALMNQREEFLENYNSNPAQPGGGQPDYNWAFATYLQLAERKYRTPVLQIIQ